MGADERARVHPRSATALPTRGPRRRGLFEEVEPERESRPPTATLQRSPPRGGAAAFACAERLAADALRLFAHEEVADLAAAVGLHRRDARREGELREAEVAVLVRDAMSTRSAHGEVDLRDEAAEAWWANMLWT